MPKLTSLDDPDFKYPTSRNPYSKRMGEFPGIIFADNDSEGHRGRWLKKFESVGNRPLHVEIGCNAAHVILEWATRHPADAFIGIDWKVKAIHRAAEKARKRDLKNLIFLRAHAARLEWIFDAAEVDSVSLFFPDPWPKKAQWRNRFVTSDSFRAVHQVLKPAGVYHIKTDHPGYFAWMEVELEKFQKTAESPWMIESRSTNKHKDHPAPLELKIPEVTLFEKLFIADGIPIHELILRKKP